MNYLAHSFLSGQDEKVFIGNFIGDAVKGGDYRKYPPAVRKGILLHRQIDDFTDRHPVVHHSKSLLGENFGHYKGVVIDILYDYFLSRNWEVFTSEPKEKFIANIYEIIRNNFAFYPGEMKIIAWKIIENDGLNSYAGYSGLTRVFTQMDKQVRGQINMLKIMELLPEIEARLNADFLSFFPEIIRYTGEFLRLETI